LIDDRVTVIAATGLEFRAARTRLAPGARVIRGGIGLPRAFRSSGGIVVSCGIAGGLNPSLPTGTVLVPKAILLADGTLRSCDPALVRCFLAAAKRLGYEASDMPLVSSQTMITGAERSVWAGRGYGGVDMESGRIEAARLACVRVVLDTPQREISPAWQRPLRAVLTPRAWADLPFLMRNGPRCAHRAAEVIADGLREGGRTL
jgi:hypothetical protein